MTVSSPVATASVRGTSFEFDTRNLWVNHGKVSFRGNKGIMMMVNAGSGTRLLDDGKAADPITIKIAEYTPPAPVGTDSGGSGEAPASASTTLLVELDYGSDG